jgi:hypothetical protein
MTRNAITKPVMSGTLGLVAFMLSSSAPSAFARAARDPFPPDYNQAIGAVCRSVAEDQACTLGGREWSYWFSFTTELTGLKTYTVVAIGRPRDGVSDLLGTTAKMPIAQVTYGLRDNAWTLIGRQIDLGEVYVNNTGNPSMSDDDGDAAYLEQPLQGGSALVGYPTVTMAGGGVNLHGHVLFRSDPAKPGTWSFGGEIVDASDNWNDCDRETAPEKCYRSWGKLALTGKTVAGWPELQSTQTGTLPGPDGQARRAKPADGSVWRFSAASHAYETDSTR